MCFNFQTGFVFRDEELYSGLSGAASSSRRGKRSGQCWLGGGPLSRMAFVLWPCCSPKPQQTFRATLTHLKIGPEPERKCSRLAGSTFRLCPCVRAARCGLLRSLALQRGTFLLTVVQSQASCKPVSRPRGEEGPERRGWALATTQEMLTGAHPVPEDVTSGQVGSGGCPPAPCPVPFMELRWLILCLCFPNSVSSRAGHLCPQLRAQPGTPWALSW